MQCYIDVCYNSHGPWVKKGHREKIVFPPVQITEGLYYNTILNFI